eukprot:NODE_492_length_7766_cov_0.167210.p6 type:complete len:104 gc:universal NODE_492_length_7766_cov_0.167210:1529-1218(-)
MVSYICSVNTSVGHLLRSTNKGLGKTSFRLLFFNFSTNLILSSIEYSSQMYTCLTVLKAPSISNPHWQELLFFHNFNTCGSNFTFSKSASFQKVLFQVTIGGN